MSELPGARHRLAGASDHWGSESAVLLSYAAPPVTFTLKLPQPNKLNGPPGDPASAASHWHGAATHDPRDSDDNH